MNDKNVILLNMSLMNNTAERAYYRVDLEDKAYRVSGINSMAAGTKAILLRLNQEKKKIDRIVVLHTKEANDSYVQYKGEICDFAYNCKSNVDYYSGQDVIETVPVNALEDIAGTDMNTLFCDVEVGDTQLNVKSIEGILSLISFEDSEEVIDKVNLFVDTQGGNRAVTNMINAVIEMTEFISFKGLNSSGIKIRCVDRYATNYNRNNGSNKLNSVYVASSHYQINNLVSAMKAFLNYGKAEQLEEYITNLKDGREYENEKKLVKVIQRIADAIQICSSDSMEQALNYLSSIVHDSTLQYEDSYFELLINQICMDYGKLLDEHTAVDTIEWCFRKGFTQQALTYIESKIPDVYLHEIHKINLANDTSYSSDALLKDFKGVKPYIKDMDALYFYEVVSEYGRLYKNEVDIIKGNKIAIEVDPKYDFVKRFAKNYLSVYEGSNISNKYRYCSGPFLSESFVIKGEKNNHEIKTEILTDSSKDVINLFWVLHMALKQERNNANHASEKSNRLTLKTLNRLIDFYVKLVKHIITYKATSSSEEQEYENQLRQLAIGIFGYSFEKRAINTVKAFDDKNKVNKVYFFGKVNNEARVEEAVEKHFGSKLKVIFENDTIIKKYISGDTKISNSAVVGKINSKIKEKTGNDFIFVIDSRLKSLGIQNDKIVYFDKQDDGTWKAQ